MKIEILDLSGNWQIEFSLSRLDKIPITVRQEASGYPAKNEYTSAADWHSLPELSPWSSFSSCHIYQF